MTGSLTATDPDPGDTLTFSKVSGWREFTVAANGALAGTPGNYDVGANSFTVKVTDAAGANATATLNIAVINVNDAPTFTANPINTVSATQGNAYSATIAGSAADIDAGDTLTYSKVSGPAWLNVAANGALTGIPTNSDVGVDSFTVKGADAAGAKPSDAEYPGDQRERRPGVHCQPNQRCQCDPGRGLFRFGLVLWCGY